MGSMRVGTVEIETSLISSCEAGVCGPRLQRNLRNGHTGLSASGNQAVLTIRVKGPLAAASDVDHFEG